MRPKRALGETPRSLWLINRRFREKGKPVQVRIARSTLPPPVLTYQGDGKWRLEEPYVVGIPERLTIPAGFRFDLASIPRFAWWLIAPFELGIVAPLVHDFLYQKAGMGRIPRSSADIIFRTLMVAERIPNWRIVLAYRVVRLFAGVLWREA
jgi:hypothetical protein